MASNTATLAIKVTTDADKAAADLDAVGKKAGGFESGLNKAAVGAAAAGVAIVAFGKSALDAASNAQQAAGAVDAIYGDTADTIHSFAKTAAKDTGLAASDYEDMAAVFGAQLKNMGVATQDLAPQTDELISLGADLAAQFGGSTADAVAALSSLMKGEADPIEKYGVAIKQADIAAKEAELGLSGLTGEAAKAATTQAMLALLAEQTGDAVGAFGREADTAAGQTARANAQWQDTQATLGAVLLPVVAAVSGELAKLAGIIQDNSKIAQVLIGVIGAVAAVILVAKAATIAYQAATTAITAASKIWAAAQWLVNAALTANPIGIVIVAIGALVAAIVVLVKNWDTVKAAFVAVWDWVSSHWKQLLPLLTGPIGLAVTAIVSNFDKIRSVAQSVFSAVVSAVHTVVGPINSVISAVQSLISWLGKIKVPNVGSMISSLNPFMLPPPAPVRYAAPAVPGSGTRAATGTMSAGAGGITINVSGALDPDAVARQIERVLRSRSRRVGGIGQLSAGVR